MNDSAGLLTRLSGGSAATRLPVSPLLVDALADLTAAATADEVAAVAVEHAVGLTGARASALGLLTATRTDLQLVGSAGYNCDSMAVGARLPLDAGLPITEAARTGRPVVRTGGGGGGWTAVPLAPAPADPVGALVVSLPPGVAPVDVGLLVALAEHTRRALHRCRRPAGLSSVAVPSHSLGVERLQVAVRSDPLDGARGGDLVETVADGRGGLWLLVADVCGNDAAAHQVARTVRLLTRALAPHVDDPAELLHELDQLLADDAGDRYVTALAVHARADGVDAGSGHGAGHGGAIGTAAAVRVAVASAGHPLPVLVGPTGGNSLGDTHRGGLPLNLGLGQPVGATRHDLVLVSGHALFAYTDGLTDRRDRYLPDDIVADVCARAARLEEPSMVLETVFDVLTAAQGPAGDDAAAALLRIG